HSYLNHFSLQILCHPRALPFSLHDALPISENTTSESPCPRVALPVKNSLSGKMPMGALRSGSSSCDVRPRRRRAWPCPASTYSRSEEHTSELQSRGHLVCRLLLEKKKKKIK